MKILTTYESLKFKVAEVTHVSSWWQTCDVNEVLDFWCIDLLISGNKWSCLFWQICSLYLAAMSMQATPTNWSFLRLTLAISFCKYLQIDCITNLNILIKGHLSRIATVEKRVSCSMWNWRWTPTWDKFWSSITSLWLLWDWSYYHPVDQNSAHLG